MADVKMTAKAIVCEIPSGEQFLFATIEIDCPVCGERALVIPGHHMKALAQLLNEWIELHPDLVGSGEISVVKREHFSGTLAGNPEDN